MKGFLCSFFFFLFLTRGLPAQEIPVHKGEFWGGYFLTLRLSEKYSIWNDFHFVPAAFFISRHGITKHFNDRLFVTAGYAWVQTSTAFTDRLNRYEHRPWAQGEFRQAITQKLNYRFRFRYDFRIRRRVEMGIIQNEFMHYSRLRFMNGFSFPLVSLKSSRRINFVLQNETLLNFGREITVNNLDQNRLWLLFSYRVNRLSIMPGYEYRFVPWSHGNVNYHGLAIWVIQEINLKRDR